MNLNSELERRITLAVEWLAGMHSGGCYFRSRTNGVLGPHSPSTTGYAAHLFAWLFAIHGRDADRRSARGAAEWLAGHMLSGEDEKWRLDAERVGFFDLGIAGRGLFAVSKQFQRTEFWDVAIQIGSLMRLYALTAPGLYHPTIRREQFSLYHPTVRIEEGKIITTIGGEGYGPHFRKAAIIWKFLKAFGDYDDLDRVFSEFPIIAIVAAQPEAKKKKPRPTEEDSQLELQRFEQSTALHQWACSAEALAMGEASHLRAAKTVELLEQRGLSVVDSIGTLLRCDLLAQFIRLKMMLGMPPETSLLDMLFDFQRSDGGFHFYRLNNTLSDQLDVPATLFAVQAMALARNPAELCRMPGPLGRRELAIV